MFIRRTSLDQSLQIAGSLHQDDNLTINDEPNGLGSEISGQNGSAAEIATSIGNTAVITGLTGMIQQSIGRFITLSGADLPINNDTFLITNIISSSSVEVSAASAITDPNNGALNWQERNPYSLEDDLNFIRTDRKNIKGTTTWHDGIPTYIQPSDETTNVPTNLTNISGKTLDAKVFIIERKFLNVTIANNTSFITITDIGNLKHSVTNDQTGIPLFDDGPYFLDYDSCYVEFIHSSEGTSLERLVNTNQRIFGLTRDGASTSPDSIEIEFRYVSIDQPISNSFPYIWENGQTSVIDIYYGFAVRADQLLPSAFRTELISGIIGNPNFSNNLNRIVLETDGKVVYVGDGDIVLKV